jgi:hypothetical protein
MLHTFGKLFTNPDNTVIFISLLLLSCLLPLAILFAKVFFKDRRLYAAKILASEFPKLAETYTFSFAVAKYLDAAGPVKETLSKVDRTRICRSAFSEIPAYILPVLSYATICATGFYTAIAITVVTQPDHFDNYLIYGMHAATAEFSGNKSESEKPGPASHSVSAATSQETTVGEQSSEQKLKSYGRGTIAVSVAGFAGAYLWTLIFLARRVTNFDLSPFSFLRATIQICLAAFVCIFLRHLYDSISQAIWQSTTPTNSSWLLALAFLVGFYPALGLNYLQERFAFLRFKTRNANAEALARELSLDMVDGIDSYIKFRLGEYEIEDIEKFSFGESHSTIHRNPIYAEKNSRLGRPGSVDLGGRQR